MERPGRAYLREGWRVREGPPISCAEPHPSLPGRPCNGFLGSPAVGAILDLVLPASHPLPPCRPGVWLQRCPRCSAVYLWGLPSPLPLPGEGCP
jgi:hypothetical protein